jgi:hypothetical protein
VEIARINDDAKPGERGGREQPDLMAQVGVLLRARSDLTAEEKGHLQDVIEGALRLNSAQRAARERCPQHTIDYFTSQHPQAWSAALIPDETGRFIVENSFHRPRRRRSNVTHEMAHLLLEHEFDCVLLGDGQSGSRNPANRSLEEEAAELAGELLVPASAAKRAAVEGKTDDQVVGDFDVSTELARWHLNVSGARLIAQRAARKKHASPH